MNQLSNQPPLTAISRVRRVIRGLPVDRLPAQPMSMIFSARNAGMLFIDYTKDGRKMAEAQLKLAADFGIDCLLTCSDPAREVIDIAGDASVQMTMQEMSTAVQFELPIKIFILNNQYMGMVRQWQQLLHGNRLSHSYSEALPDFVKLADAFGCVGIQAIKPGDLDGAIKEMINVKRPVLFDCRVAALENCFPMIPSGKAHNEMLLPAEANDEATAAAFAGGKALV